MHRSSRTKPFAALWRGLVSLWMAAGIAVLALATIEVGPDIHLVWKKVLRWVDPDGGKADRKASADTYQGADWTKAYWKEYAQTGARFAPYVHWRMRPLDGRFVTVDADGRRQTWNPDLAVDTRPVRIFLFGGSTMFGMGARNDHTIASELARLLAPLGPVQVTNFGQPGWVTRQEAIEFAEHLRGGDVPDIAVFYDGGNDIFSTLSQGKPGLPHNTDNRVREFNLTHEERRGDLYREAALGFFDRTLKMIRGGTPTAPPTFGEKAARLGEATAADMAATADQLRAMAAAKGVDVVFALQPILFGKAVKTPYEQREATDFYFLEDGLVAGMAATAAHPAFKDRPDFLDLSRLFADRAEPFFVDFIHLGEHGNAVVAEALAGAVAPLVKARLAARPAIREETAR